MNKGKATKKKCRLLPHERDLLHQGKLVDISHNGAGSTWLHASSKRRSDAEVTMMDNSSSRVLCYRHMGDMEVQYLLKHNQLPSTQPYQTLTREDEGRRYCESYLRQHNKYVDTHPTTVVEFDCPKQLIDDSFDNIQCKVEDGTISHGLGHKAGRTLSRFNSELIKGNIRWRIVLVKRKRE